MRYLILLMFCCSICELSAQELTMAEVAQRVNSASIRPRNTVMIVSRSLIVVDRSGEPTVFDRNKYILPTDNYFQVLDVGTVPLIYWHGEAPLPQRILYNFNPHGSIYIETQHGNLTPDIYYSFPKNSFPINPHVRMAY